MRGAGRGPPRDGDGARRERGGGAELDDRRAGAREEAAVRPAGAAHAIAATSGTAAATASAALMRSRRAPRAGSPAATHA